MLKQRNLNEAHNHITSRLKRRSRSQQKIFGRWVQGKRINGEVNLKTYRIIQVKLASNGDGRVKRWGLKMTEKPNEG